VGYEITRRRRTTPILRPTISSKSTPESHLQSQNKHIGTMCTSPIATFLNNRARINPRRSRAPTPEPSPGSESTDRRHSHLLGCNISYFPSTDYRHAGATCTSHRALPRDRILTVWNHMYFSQSNISQPRRNNQHTAAISRARINNLSQPEAIMNHRAIINTQEQLASPPDLFQETEYTNGTHSYLLYPDLSHSQS
jgi:hypothetical protein